MAFTRKRGKTKLMWLPMTPSTVATSGALVEATSGKLTVATNTTKCHNTIGVIRKTIAATDADYASDRLVPVEVPVEKYVEWEAPVSVGTLAATSVGAYFDTGTDDLGTSVDQSASAENVVFCTKFISATLGWFILNIGPESVGDID
jgi:hypothetical protein